MSLAQRRIILDDTACDRISERARTPCFAIFPQVLRSGFRILSTARGQRPGLEFAYPIKTMPVAYLLRCWRSMGRYVEASSESEFHLARACGFSPTRIIVSGPAKAGWLTRVRVPNLTVVVDSCEEARTIARKASNLAWRVGLRFAPRTQVDPDNPAHPDQFGIDHSTWPIAVAALRAAGAEVRLLQFHLGGWSGDLSTRLETLRELAALSASTRLRPRTIDIGGGFGQAYSGADASRITRAAARGIARLCCEVRGLFPDSKEVIAECGRVLLGPAAVLVLKVMEVKEKYGHVFVICDGGRVNHALPSDWEEHHMYFPAETQSRRCVAATICGPTCMAWDFLARGRVPHDIKPGSFIVYDAAGAYHWPWQSSFSHPRASVAVVTQTSTGRLSVRALLNRQSRKAWLGACGA